MEEGPVTSKDSLSVNITEDGKVELDWDPNDPRWSWSVSYTHLTLPTIYSV